MRGTNETFHLEYIKNRNMLSIIKLVRGGQPMSRAKVAEELGMSKSAVSSSVDILIEKNILLEIGVGSSTSLGGRKGILLGFNPKAKKCMGVSISSSQLSILISDLDGQVELFYEYRFTNQIEEIIADIESCVRDSQVDFDSVAVICISVPGITDTNAGIVLESPTLDWFQVPIVQILDEYFGKPVYVLNDVDCLALGEYWIGSAKKDKIMFFIGINNGLGSALIIEGKLFSGKDSQSGEIGYTILDADDFDRNVNKFGKFGWLEERVSGWALRKTGYQLDQIFIEYQKGNLQVKPVVDKFLQSLSVMISNIVAMLNPDCVIVGGETAEYMDQELDIIRKNVEQFVPIKAEIKKADLGAKACNLGAIAYVLETEDFFNKL